MIINHILMVFWNSKVRTLPPCWDLLTWVDLGPVFNIKVFNTCQIPFWPSKKFYFLGHLTKMRSAKFSPFIVKASPKTAHHKIQWLQFANSNIAGLQSWHSSRHFQIPITPAILTLQLWLGIDCNFSLASTTICERGFSKQNLMKSDCRSRSKLKTLDALMRETLDEPMHPMENIDWARIFDTWKSTKNQRVLPLELDDD